jgi:hypothetical protein
MRSTGPLRALLAVVAALAVLLSPGTAAAEGPGYGGGADELKVKWNKGKNRTIVIHGVGFGAGSVILVRLGSGDERSVVADPNGVLRLVVDAAVFASGVSILAAGRSPSGTALTLVGSVPREPDEGGLTDVLEWLVVGVAALAGVGGVAGRRRRPAAVAAAEPVAQAVVAAPAAVSAAPSGNRRPPGRNAQGRNGQGRNAQGRDAQGRDGRGRKGQGSKR